MPRPIVMVFEDAGKAADTNSPEGDDARETEEEDVWGGPAAVVAGEGVG